MSVPDVCHPMEPMKPDEPCPDCAVKQKRIEELEKQVDDAGYLLERSIGGSPYRTRIEELGVENELLEAKVYWLDDIYKTLLVAGSHFAIPYPGDEIVLKDYRTNRAALAEKGGIHDTTSEAKQAEQDGR